MYGGIGKETFISIQGNHERIIERRSLGAEFYGVRFQKFPSGAGDRWSILKRRYLKKLFICF